MHTIINVFIPKYIIWIIIPSYSFNAPQLPVEVSIPIQIICEEIPIPEIPILRPTSLWLIKFGA